MDTYSKFLLGKLVIIEYYAKLRIIVGHYNNDVIELNSIA